MSTMAQCPSCKAEQLARGTCKYCGAEMGIATRGATPHRSAPRHDWRRGGSGGGMGATAKPFFIKLGTLFSPLAGAFCFLMALVALSAGPLITYEINEQPVTQAYFASHALPPIVLAGGVLLAIGYGFWKERSWSRELVMGFWLLVGVCVLALTAYAPPTKKMFALGDLVIDVGIAVWYFYFKPNVVEYYRSLA